MSNWIAGIIAWVILMGFMFPILVMFLEDTETFRAIDEKIAKWIKGGRSE